MTTKHVEIFFILIFKIFAVWKYRILLLQDFDFYLIKNSTSNALNFFYQNIFNSSWNINISVWNNHFANCTLWISSNLDNQEF